MYCSLMSEYPIQNFSLLLKLVGIQPYFAGFKRTIIHNQSVINAILPNNVHAIIQQ